MVLRAERLPVPWIQGRAAILPLQDVVGVEPDTAATAVRLASRPLAAPMGALQDFEAPSLMFGRKKLGISNLRCRSSCPRIEHLEPWGERSEPSHC
ncbi:hypothetical protein MGN01_45970 [Methylobacterium gnaphalii]|uniref:Uncharacterized protein n=1 Tax=Methylobacterium gnaphalii TaxID=1010610 RepID=A0A512JS65_9HYPH|nr:hypothetical protein MGN01_45970 [Methylobacterium gnaphalii]